MRITDYKFICDFSRPMRFRICCTPHIAKLTQAIQKHSIIAVIFQDRNGKCLHEALNSERNTIILVYL